MSSSEVDVDGKEFVATTDYDTSDIERDFCTDPVELATLEAELEPEFLLPPLVNGEEHVCDDECDCDFVDDVELGGEDVLRYIGWGDVNISPSGREILKFLTTVLKGKSMSFTKATDILRY